MGMIVIFYYDFALTMPQEIKHIWSSKFKLVNVLVIALRYVTVFGYIPELVLTFVSVINFGSGETVSTNRIREGEPAGPILMTTFLFSAVVRDNSTVVPFLK